MNRPRTNTTCLGLFAVGLASLILLGTAQAEPRFECFRKAYPHLLVRLESEPDGRRSLVTSDGHRFLWDGAIRLPDGVQAQSMGLRDTVEQPYPRMGPTPVGPSHDPGRMRHYPWLKYLYGRSPNEVRARLEPVNWLPGVADSRLLFSARHGAADALRAVSRELVLLGKDFHKFVRVTAGTYNWRRIAGTERLSAHAFGIALDINVIYTDYWRWTMTRSPALPYQNRIPIEIVHAFERNGFIWGGRWRHFDTMHFEYRPEFSHEPCGALRTKSR